MAIPVRRARGGDCGTGADHPESASPSTIGSCASTRILAVRPEFLGPLRGHNSCLKERSPHGALHACRRPPPRGPSPNTATYTAPNMTEGPPRADRAHLRLPGPRQFPSTARDRTTEAISVNVLLPTVSTPSPRGVRGSPVGIVAIGMTARDTDNPLADQVRERVPNLPRSARHALTQPSTHSAALSTSGARSELAGPWLNVAANKLLPPFLQDFLQLLEMQPQLCKCVAINAPPMCVGTTRVINLFQYHHHLVFVDIKHIPKHMPFPSDNTRQIRKHQRRPVARQQLVHICRKRIPSRFRDSSQHRVRCLTTTMSRHQGSSQNHPKGHFYLISAT